MTGGAVAAQQAIIAQAIKASGSIVRLEPADFEQVVQRARDPVVIRSRTGMFTRKNEYLTSYKGLTFYTKTVNVLHFPASVELYNAQRIWIPG